MVLDIGIWADLSHLAASGYIEDRNDLLFLPQNLVKGRAQAVGGGGQDWLTWDTAGDS